MLAATAISSRASGGISLKVSTASLIQASRLDLWRAAEWPCDLDRLPLSSVTSRLRQRNHPLRLCIAQGLC